MNKKLNNVFYAAVAVLAFLSTAGVCAAQINLSVTPVSGGDSLRMGRVALGDKVNKEVRVRVSSTENQRYQIYQRIVTPLANERNQTIGRNVLQTYSLPGSNATGTLYAQTPEALTYSDQPIYSSNGNGDSDSFTMVYSVDGSAIQEQGSFFGKILYVLRPIGGSDQQEVFVNIYLETEGSLKVEIEGTSGMDRIHIAPQGGIQNEGYAKISFEGNFGQQVKVYQEFERYPEDELMNELNADHVQFRTSGASSGEMAVPVLTDLSRKRILLYSSAEGEDSFYVNYSVNPDNEGGQKAGNYSGRVRYIVDIAGTEYPQDLEFAVDVEPVFNLHVELPPEGINFARILPGDPPQVKEIKVRVTSNLGRPFMVNQTITSPLSNEEGKEIEHQYFSMRGEIPDGVPGRVQYEDFAPVSKSGDDPVYFSDAKGSSAEFKVYYRLKPYDAIAAGNYSTSIMYSLGEI